MDCIVNYRNHSASCYVFSLPFICEELRSIDNTFPNIIFNHVRRLSVKDDFPFEHEFFHRIASSFPLLKELCVNNITQQSLTILNNDNSNGDQFCSIITFNYLSLLRFEAVHIHYVEQFLNQTKTHLPLLTKLAVKDYYLIRVTKRFTRDITRLNCMKVKELVYIGHAGKQYSKDFKGYFPRLERHFPY
jgi:hypothetical protein